MRARFTLSGIEITRMGSVLREMGFENVRSEKNYQQEVNNPDEMIDMLEAMENDLTTVGVRAVATKADASRRLIWWRDFCNVVRAIGEPNSIVEPRPRRQRPTIEQTPPAPPRRVFDSNEIQPAVVETEHGDLMNRAMREMDALRTEPVTAEMVERAIMGNSEVEAQAEEVQAVPTPAETLEQYMSRMNIVATSVFSNMGGHHLEVEVELPRWLAVNLNCSKKLRGYLVEKAVREVDVRGVMRNVPSYHFIGHNAIGNTERCHRCSRELTHPVSRVVGYGPECCSRIGLSRRVDMNDMANVETLDRMIRETPVDVWLPMRVITYTNAN